MAKTIFLVIFITASNQKEAEKIAAVLLREKLAGCITIVPKVKSLYWWQKRIEKSNEVLLIVKTAKNKLPRLIKKIKEVHSYQVPEIIALPIIGGDQKYLKWLKETAK